MWGYLSATVSASAGVLMAGRFDVCAHLATPACRYTGASCNWRWRIPLGLKYATSGRSPRSRSGSSKTVFLSPPRCSSKNCTLQRQLIPRTHFGISRQAHRTKRRFRAKIILLPNGADMDLLSRTPPRDHATASRSENAYAVLSYRRAWYRESS